MNSYMRFRLALTEDEPTIKLTMKRAGLNCQTQKTSPIESSLALLENFTNAGSAAAFTEAFGLGRTFRHPEFG